MFDLLKSSQKAPPISLGPGGVASVLVHAAVVAALVVDQVGQSSNPSSESWEEVIHGLTYIAPPDVNSAASQVQLTYEASGGGNGEAPKQEKTSPDGAAARGSGPGENAVASVSADEALDQLASPSEDPYENAFSSVEVEAIAERDASSAAPIYPRELMAEGVEGYAAMRFVVDSTGLVDLTTVRVLESTHREFAVAVQEAMPLMKFTPARLGERPVRQLAEQVFAFRILRSTVADGDATAPRPDPKLPEMPKPQLPDVPRSE